MIRVCHLAKYYSPFRGGIETHVQSLANAQQQSGMDVTVACINHLDKNGENVWSSRFARTASYDSEESGVCIKRFGRFASFSRFDFCLGLVRFLKGAHLQFDLLHLHVPNPVFCVALAIAKPKLPLITTYHSDIVNQKFARVPFHFVENRVFAKVSKFIVATREYATTSLVLKPYQSRIEIIPFGLDLQPYLVPSQKAIEFRDKLLAIAGGLPLWLCVGRMVYYKGFEFAVRALANCRGKLMFVGSGPLKTTLEQVAANLGVADRIDWYDGLSDDELVGAYHAATALWFPSIMRSEAFGLVQVEAMACGCPVINTDIEGSGVPAVSRDNVSGITVAPASASELTAAANRLDTLPELRARLSQGAAQRATEHFSLQRMAEQTNDVYRSVLGLSADASSASSAALVG